MNPPSGAQALGVLIEIDDSPASIAHLRQVLPPHVELCDNQNSPSGYKWIELRIGRGPGDNAFEDAASDVLNLLERSLRLLPAYRLVNGNMWLRRAAAP